jgi:hypothetical protein
MRLCTRELSEWKSSLERQILRMVLIQKNKIPFQSTLEGVEVFTSAAITGVQMGEMSKLG